MLCKCLRAANTFITVASAAGNELPALRMIGRMPMGSGLPNMQGH